MYYAPYKGWGVVHHLDSHTVQPRRNPRGALGAYLNIGKETP